MRFLIVFFAMFFAVNVYGDVSIDMQIAEIMKAPKDKRVELMNALKIKLANMNKEQRGMALQKLQNKMAGSVNNGSVMQYQFSTQPMRQGGSSSIGSFGSPKINK